MLHHLLFTALHGMQSRYSDGNSVCPSVCQTVLCGECKANVMCLCAQTRGNASNLKYSFNTHSTTDGWRHSLSESAAGSYLNTTPHGRRCCWRCGCCCCCALATRRCAVQDRQWGKTRKSYWVLGAYEDLGNLPTYITTLSPVHKLAIGILLKAK